jgi:Na+/glutamate symporter
LRRGSWLALALMLTIFCSKYAVAVACAMQSELRQSLAFALPVCLLFGLFNGIIIGRAMRCIAACRDATGGADPAQV